MYEIYCCKSSVGGAGQGRLRWHSRTTDLGLLLPVNVTTEDTASGDGHHNNSVVADPLDYWLDQPIPTRHSLQRLNSAHGRRVFDTHTGSERTVGAQHTIADAHRSLIYEVAWSPDDAELVTSSADNTVQSCPR
eukprot:COSAG02_NODE_8113_length_2704_cov_1.884453_3_plen_134_part_00